MKEKKYFILDLKGIECYQKIIDEFGEEVYEKKTYLEKPNYYLNHILLVRNDNNKNLYEDCLTGIFIGIKQNEDGKTITISPANITAPLSSLKEITQKHKEFHEMMIERLNIGFELSLLIEEIIIDGYLCQRQKVIPASRIRQRKYEI